jgi:D-hydroxyproline dehydrogenase subunit gamma
MFTSIAPFAQNISILFNGMPITARVGETIAACLLRACVRAFRTTPVGGAPRLPFCMIGHCFDCVVEIECKGSRQACLTLVQEGMRIGIQDGEVRLPKDA